MAPGDHVLPDPAAFPRACRTAGPDETAVLGARIAATLAGGEIVLLHGDLGAGKTTLVQGICAGLDVRDEVVSPTFTIVNTYPGRPTVHHLDFYRIEPGHDLDDIGVSDILDEIWEGQAVGLVEWPGPLLPRLGTAPRIEVLVRPGPGPTGREWLLRATPSLSDAWAALFPVREEGTC
jgi:tRNA threonylcarbamoyladenosine biosynthesis protein TsaE